MCKGLFQSPMRERQRVEKREGWRREVRERGSEGERDY
jgi:hypothetical protein